MNYVRCTRRDRANKGMSLVEILVGVAILLLGFYGFVSVYTHYVKYSANTVPTIQASYLLSEGIEAVQTLRDTSWSADIAPLSTTTTYYLSFTSGTSSWATTTVASEIDAMFLRTVNIADVQRDSNSNIVSSGGTYDPNTKEVTVTVAWSNGLGTTTKNLSVYLTNLFSN